MQIRFWSTNEQEHGYPRTHFPHNHSRQAPNLSQRNRRGLPAAAAAWRWRRRFRPLQLLAQHRGPVQALPRAGGRHARIRPIHQGCGSQRSLRRPGAFDARPVRRAQDQVRACRGQLPGRRLRTAHGIGCTLPGVGPGADGPRRREHHPWPAHQGPQPAAGLLQRRRSDAGENHSIHSRVPGVRRQPGIRPDDRRALSRQHRAGSHGSAAAAPAAGPEGGPANGLHPR
ncbi:hypothetical protein D9M70_418980 [compost metagenome]